MAIADVVVAVLALAAGMRGWRRGLLGQAFEFGGGLAGLVAGVAVGPRIASSLTNSAGFQGALISIVAMLVGLSAGQVVGYLLGQRFGSFARRAHLGGVDSALGSLFGVGVTLITYWLLGSLLVAGPIAEVSRQLRRSEILRAMKEVGEPPDVLAYVRQYLDTSGFPQVFADLPEGPSSPVDLPATKVARRALKAAGDSTVQVVAPACGGAQLGSGWIAAPSTVVTNAHVVAGGDRVTVEQPGGDELPGSVVLFDPDIDVAVIAADGLAGPVLELAERGFGNGTPGATLGYPGDANGRLDVQRAAVRRRFTARGYDIYGRDVVSREVYELRAHVRQGDSGGPFVLGDGRVAGVVFAASTTHRATGYALTGAQVADAIARGSRADETVDTGPCTH
ncbi:acid resistance serine protease MarP [soil metagenome]